MSGKRESYYFAVFLDNGCIQAGVGSFNYDDSWNKGALLKVFGGAQDGTKPLSDELSRERKEAAKKYGAEIAELSKIKLFVDFGRF